MMKKTFARTLAFSMLAGLCLCAQDSPVAPSSSGTYGRALKLAKPYEIAPMPRPEWADHKGEPLFRMCWLSDLHVSEGAPLEMVTKACNTVRDTLKPDFVLITGDNNTNYVGDIPAEAAKAPRLYQQQLWLKGFLDKELARPYEILPGDNDPEYFNDVFGSFHRVFDYGGFHFLLTGTDSGGSQEGCSIFSEKTFKWMTDDLKANKSKPTFFVMHETIWPPFFIDGNKTATMVSDSPNVLAVLSGHMHLDLDFDRGSWRQLVAPAIGRSHRPAFKHLRFYNDVVIIESYEWGNGTFKQAQKWQKIDIPRKFRKNLHAARAKENASELPPSPKKLDNKLNERANELSNGLMGFVLSFGIGRVYGK